MSKKLLPKNKAGGVAQGGDSEFKPQYCKQTNKQTKTKTTQIYKDCKRVL
jgi:hypothetical protein